MQPLDLNDFIEFNEQKVNPVVLANEPDMRLLLLCMRAGQQVPEHSAAGSITVQAVTGRATFYNGEEACEMYTGSLVRLEAGRLHRVEAHTDAALLVTMIKPSRVIDTGETILLPNTFGPGTQSARLIKGGVPEP